MSRKKNKPYYVQKSIITTIQMVQIKKHRISRRKIYALQMPASKAGKSEENSFVQVVS